MGQIFVAMLAGVCSKDEVAMVMELLTNFSDEGTEGRSSVEVEEERMERGGWIVNS